MAAAALASGAAIMADEAKTKYLNRNEPFINISITAVKYRPRVTRAYKCINRITIPKGLMETLLPLPEFLVLHSIGKAFSTDSNAFQYAVACQLMHHQF